MHMENEYLCFVKFVGTDIDDMNIYEFLFTTDTETFWGENFEYMPCCLCNELIPDEESYSRVERIKTNLKLCLVTDSCCNSMQDCMDGIISLAFLYDEDENLVFNFPYGISYESIKIILAKKNILFEE